jgi:hypothetical protein
MGGDPSGETLVGADGCDQVFQTYPKEETAKEILKVDMKVKTIEGKNQVHVSQRKYKRVRGD